MWTFPLGVLPRACLCLECHLWGRGRVLAEEERADHIVFAPFSAVSMKCVPLEGQIQTLHVSGLGTKESVSHPQQGRLGCRRLADVRTATLCVAAHHSLGPQQCTFPEIPCFPRKIGNTSDQICRVNRGNSGERVCPSSLLHLPGLVPFYPRTT